jgi:hypothetical protein
VLFQRLPNDLSHSDIDCRHYITARRSRAKKRTAIF